MALLGTRGGCVAWRCNLSDYRQSKRCGHLGSFKILWHFLQKPSNLTKSMLESTDLNFPRSFIWICHSSLVFLNSCAVLLCTIKQLLCSSQRWLHFSSGWSESCIYKAKSWSTGSISKHLCPDSFLLYSLAAASQPPHSHWWASGKIWLAQLSHLPLWAMWSTWPWDGPWEPNMAMT